MALLGIATVWCDFIVMYLLKKRNVYREHKYQRVDDDSQDPKRNVQGDDDADELESDRPEAERLIKP